MCFYVRFFIKNSALADFLPQGFQQRLRRIIREYIFELGPVVIDEAYPFDDNIVDPPRPSFSITL